VCVLDKFWKIEKLIILLGASIHGDVSQTERTRIMFAYKNMNVPILIATDVASRGLDIKSIKVVVNYQVINLSILYLFLNMKILNFNYH
jgi:superfamily II DNA/RNA helicase